MAKPDQNEGGTEAVSQVYGKTVRYARDERG